MIRGIEGSSRGALRAVSSKRLGCQSPGESDGSCDLGRACGIFLTGMGPIWFVSGGAVAIQARDASVAPLVWVWSVPVFVFGWVLMGLPLIAMGDVVCRTPKMILGVAGAVAGIFSHPASSGDPRVDRSQNEFAFCVDLARYGRLGRLFAGIGATGTVLYGWLLSRRSRGKA